MPRCFAVIAICLAAPALTACGGARQEQLQLELDETRRTLDGLRDAYDAQRVQLESMRDRLDLVEDQLEARALHAQVTAPSGAQRTLPVVRLAPPVDREPEPEPDSAPEPAATGTPPITPGELPPATITQADIDRLDGYGARVTDDPAPRPRRRRAVPPPANAAHAGNIGTRPVATQPDFDAREAGPIPTYKAAVARYEAGDHAGAIRGFEALVQTWPDHGFADNALYYVGRCRYARAEYRAALETFRAVLTRYPTGNQVPDALLMTGLTLEKLGRDAEGRDTLGRLRAMYPDSAAARQAAARLERADPRM